MADCCGKYLICDGRSPFSVMCAHRANSLENDKSFATAHAIGIDLWFVWRPDVPSETKTVPIREFSRRAIKSAPPGDDSGRSRMDTCRRVRSRVDACNLSGASRRSRPTVAQSRRNINPLPRRCDHRRSIRSRAQTMMRRFYF